MVPFPSPPAGSRWGFFFDLHCDNLVELQEVKLTEVWHSLILGPPGLFTSQTRPHCASRILPVPVKVLLPQHWFPWRLLLVNVCSDNLWFSVVDFLSLQLWRQWFAGRSHFCDESTKRCWFFSLSSILFIVRMEGKHLSYMLDWKLEIACLFLATSSCLTCIHRFPITNKDVRELLPLSSVDPSGSFGVSVSGAVVSKWGGTPWGKCQTLHWGLGKNIRTQLTFIFYLTFLFLFL